MNRPNKRQIAAMLYMLALNAVIMWGCLAPSVQAVEFVEFSASWCSPCFKLESDAQVHACPHHDCLMTITPDEVYQIINRGALSATPGKRAIEEIESLTLMNHSRG